MNTRRMNITLPKDLASLIADKPNKSAYIAEALREKLSEDERRRSGEELAAAYRQASTEQVSDWDAVSGDGL